MAQNNINSGMNFTYTVPAATTITSGQLVAIGGTATDDKSVCVACGSGTAGDVIELARKGVWEVVKATGQAMAQGQKLYFNGTAITTDADDGTDPYPVAGVCYESALAAATLVKIALN